MPRMPWPWKIALALVWGLVLGIFAAAWTAATLLAAGWIYLYGDDAWPAEFTERTVPLVSGLAGLSHSRRLRAFGPRWGAFRRGW